MRGSKTGGEEADVEERKREPTRGNSLKTCDSKGGHGEGNIVEVTSVQGEEKYINNESSGKEHITVIAQ